MQSEHIEDVQRELIEDANPKSSYIVVDLVPKTMHFQFTQTRTLTLGKCKIKHTISKATYLL